MLSAQDSDVDRTQWAQPERQISLQQRRHNNITHASHRGCVPNLNQASPVTPAGHVTRQHRLKNAGLGLILERQGTEPLYPAARSSKFWNTAQMASSVWYFAQITIRWPTSLSSAAWPLTAQSVSGSRTVRRHPVKDPLYSYAEHSERSAAQNLRLSLTGGQELDICYQSVFVCAAVRRVSYAPRRSITKPLRQTRDRSSSDNESSGDDIDGG